MINTVTEIIYDIMSVAMAVFEGCWACRLFRAFVKPKWGSRFARYGVGVFWAVLNIICYFTLTTGYYEPLLLVKLIIYTLGLALFSVLWYEGGIMLRLLPALLFSAVRELSVQIANCFTGINSLVVDTVWKLADEYRLIPLEHLLTVSYTVTTSMLVLISVLKLVMIRCVIKSILKHCRFKPQPGSEAALYLLPGAVGLMMCAILRLMLISVENSFTVLLYSRYPLLYVIVPLISAAMLAAIVYSFRLCQEMTGMRMEQTDRAVLENQLANMRGTLAEKERSYESLNAVRHDMRNNLTALRGLIAEKCPGDDEVNRFFESMRLSFEQSESRVKTGNAVCDTMIGGKFGEAEREIPGIKLDAEDFAFSDSIAEPYDMGVILSNGLDNAIEACKRLKSSRPDAQTFITVRSFRRKNMYFAEIENSFDGTVKRDAESGLPQSRKESGLHGIGLRNIKKCAEKYSGGIEVIIGDGVFTLSVMIKDKQTGG